MGWITRGLFVTLAATTALLTSCAPPVAAVPCNEDEDCAFGEMCLRGVCAEGDALAPKPDAGRSADAGKLPRDGGADEHDAADPSEDDGGAPPDGPLPADGGDPLSDAGLLDGGDFTDAGPDPILDAGPPGIVSFTASPESVVFGQPVVLSWQTREVASCVLEGTDAVLEVNGQLVVERPASRPYLLRCKGIGGERYEAEVSVVVSCPTEITLGSAILTSDAELALFPSGACVDVTGDVVVANLTKPDLAALYGLRSVGGSLSIGGNPNLARLDGLELLSQVSGDVRLGFQEVDTDPLLALPALTSVHGLSALASVGIDFEVLGADSLVSLAGLERLRTIGDDLDIDESPQLQSLAGLRRLAHVGTLELSDSAALSALGLPSLAEVDNAIHLSGLPLLGSLAALSSVAGELSYIYVYNCDSLTSLAGLEGVTRLRSSLSVQLNDALVNLDGLRNLQRAERVLIRRNSALVSADLPALVEVNYTGASTCSGSYCDGDLVFDDNPVLERIDGFAALTYVRRDLVILENDGLTSVRGFGALTRVYNDLVIRSNEALLTVDAFQALETADDVLIEHNPALETLLLPRLTRIIDDVSIVNNDALRSLEGVSALAQVGGDFRVVGHARLNDLGSAPITQVGDYPECAAGCAFHVRSNPSLPAGMVTELLSIVGRPVDDGDAANVDVTGNGS